MKYIISSLHLIRNLQCVWLKFSCNRLPSFFSRNDLDYLIKEKNQKQYWEVFTFEFIDIISYKNFQNKGNHDFNINPLLFTMHALFVLFNINNTCRKNKNDNVPKWVIMHFPNYFLKCSDKLIYKLCCFYSSLYIEWKAENSRGRSTRISK